MLCPFGTQRISWHCSKPTPADLRSLGADVPQRGIAYQPRATPWEQRSPPIGVPHDLRGLQHVDHKANALSYPALRCVHGCLALCEDHEPQLRGRLSSALHRPRSEKEHVTPLTSFAADAARAHHSAFKPLHLFHHDHRLAQWCRRRSRLDLGLSRFTGRWTCRRRTFDRKP
jgi:hypothetical protein